MTTCHIQADTVHPFQPSWTTALGYDGLELEMNLTLDDDVPLLEEVRFRWSLIMMGNHAIEHGEEKLHISEETRL